MRQVREILRLHHAGVSTRQTGVRVGVAASTVRLTLQRVRAAGMTAGVLAEHSHVGLERLLFAGQEDRTSPLCRSGLGDDPPGTQAQARDADDPVGRVHNPSPGRVSAFALLRRGWEARLSVTMRQAHRAGEKLFVDYAGDTVPVIVDRLTGQRRDAQIFVAVLGASNSLYAEASWTQGLADWIGSHNRALAAIGGVPALVVPDNTKVAVIKACLYDPVINRTYADLAAHYGTAACRPGPTSPATRQRLKSAC